MWVWTRQAEIDFIAKWRDSKPLTRRAGEEALFDGNPLSNSVAIAYQERGWIRQVGGGPVARRVDGLDEEVKRERWRKLKLYFQRSKRTTLRDISQKMGFKDATSLSHFIDKYGEEMAEKYGKLPKPSLSGGRALTTPAWAKVIGG